MAEINDPEKEAGPFKTTNGRGAHPLPEIALFRALAEAIQARATFVAGARDDLATAVEQALASLADLRGA